MPIEILMPALSPTMTHGNLAKWRKKEGDKVKSGDVIAEIETDKATMEVEAVDEGVIGKILVSAGTNDVAVNSLIALLLEDGEDKATLDSYQPKARAAKPSEAAKTAVASAVAAPAAASTQEGESSAMQSKTRVFASPLARKIAQQQNINLANIKGSGPRGRIVKDDVLSGGGRACGAVFTRNEREYEVVPVNNMRKVIASRLLESKQTIPHFYLTIDCNMDSLLEARESVNSHFEQIKSGNKISVNDFVIKASAMALRDVPSANVSWMGDAIYQYNNVDISVAVSIDNGLITPIIRSADHKSITEISNEMKSLAQRARTTGLAPHEFQGGGFSISNLGVFGIKQFNAIVNPPQGCILAIGATEKRAIVTENDKIEVASMVSLSLSCDHRVVDGAVGAQYLAALKKYLEAPLLMFRDSF